MKNRLEEFLRNNRRHLDNKTPNPAVLDRILEQMQERQSRKPKKVLIPFRKLPAIAACFILVVCGIVFRTLQKYPSLTAGKASTSYRRHTAGRGEDSATIRSAKTLKPEAKPESLATGKADLPLRKQALITKAKLHTLPATKQVMYAGLNNMESPASRINAAYYADKLKNTNNDVVDALVETLDTDPSANVRLAMLDGLARFYQNSQVRKKLVASLKKQQDPVVQIALINLLTGMKEPGIIEELTRIVQDDNTLNAVRDCAQSSILRLRSS